MLNYIWGGMILISLIVSLFTGQVEQTAAAAVTGAASAVETCFALLGIMCLWTGLAKIGERAGLVKVMARLLRPLTNLLFPKLDPDAPARGSIIMNVVANIFGMAMPRRPWASRPWVICTSSTAAGARPPMRCACSWC